MENNKEVLMQSLEFLESLIETFEDLSWDCQKADSTKRLEKSKECLRKAYIYAEPLLYI